MKNLQSQQASDIFNILYYWTHILALLSDETT